MATTKAELITSHDKLETKANSRIQELQVSLATSQEECKALTARLAEADRSCVGLSGNVQHLQAELAAASARLTAAQVLCVVRASSLDF